MYVWGQLMRLVCEHVRLAYAGHAQLARVTQLAYTNKEKRTRSWHQTREYT